MDRDREREKEGWDTEDMSLLQHGFVFSEEQLALVFQFQHEELTAVEGHKESYYCVLLNYLYSFYQHKTKQNTFLDRQC